MTSEPEIGGTQPVAVEVTEGKMYWWCACGRSKSQPFCDGSHKATDFVPQGWEAPKTGTVWLCACKRTGKSPLCDGSHNKL